MKLNKLTFILAAGAVMIVTLTADSKKSKGGDFLEINPNIKNEALLNELNQLKENFELERQKIQDIYNVEIQQLKDERKAEIRNLKKEFSEKKDEITRSFSGKTKPSLKPHKQKPDKTVVDKSKLKKRQ